MPFLNLDDNFADHPKNDALSDVLRHLKINAEALEKWSDRTGRRAAFNRLLARERGVA